MSPFRQGIAATMLGKRHATKGSKPLILDEAIVLVVKQDGIG
jgi:hypothetical protein